MACADGMNAFAAFVVLCQINLEAFLDMEAEARIEYCGRLIGDQRIVSRGFSLHIFLSRINYCLPDCPQCVAGTPSPRDRVF